MTRLLAFGDTQIGVATVTLAEQQKVLERIVQTALDHSVDLVLHGGDVFEGPVVTPEHLRMFIDAVRPLRDNEVPLVVIRGNGRHDLATRSVHALDVLREMEPWVEISDRPSVIWQKGFFAVATLPWVQPGHLIAQMNGQASHDQVADLASLMLMQIADGLHDQIVNFKPEAKSVLLAHWAISGAKLPTGLPVDQLREPVLSWPDLDAIGFDVIVGAHVHEPQILSDPAFGDKTVGLVVGSPQQLNHGEPGEHGCWLVDIGEAIRPGAVHADFIPIESQRFVTLDWDHGKDAAVYDEILNGDFSHSAAVPNNIVRIRFKATEEAARRIDHRALREALINAGAAKVTIEPRIQRSARTRSEAITDQLGPLDALDAYCDAQTVEPLMRERMRETLAEWMTT